VNKSLPVSSSKKAVIKYARRYDSFPEKTLTQKTHQGASHVVETPTTMKVVCTILLLFLFSAKTVCDTADATNGMIQQRTDDVESNIETSDTNELRELVRLPRLYPNY
jgi:hypothetical protein